MRSLALHTHPVLGPLVMAAAAVTLATGCRRAATLDTAALASLVHAPPVGPAPVEATLRPQRQESWFGVYLAEQKAGHAREVVEWLPDGGLRVSTTVSLRLKRNDAPMELDVTDRVEYGPPPTRSLASFETRERTGTAGGVVRRGQLSATGEQLEVVIDAGGTTERRSLPRPRESANDAVAALLVARLAANPRLETWQFDRSTLTEHRQDVEVVERRQLTLSGVPSEVLVVRTRDAARGLELVTRVTLAGQTLETTVGPGLRMVLEEADVARNLAASLPDAFRLTVLPLEGALGDPATIRRLRVALAGLNPGVARGDGRQSRDGDVLTVWRRTLTELAEVPLSAADRERWLARTALADADSPRVREFVAPIARSEPVARQVEAVVHRVHRTLRYSLATAAASASGILADGAGDCSEFARVLVAALRALGVPAREVLGLVYAPRDQGFVFHAWAEAYVDSRWLAVDATWDQVPVDATHIALGNEDPAPIVSVIGGVKAKLVDVERFESGPQPR